MMNPLMQWRRVIGTRDQASCREAGRLMQAVMDGQADPVTISRVMNHLEACRRCGLEAETYRAIKASIVAQFPVAVDPVAVASLAEFGRSLAAEA